MKTIKENKKAVIGIVIGIILIAAVIVIAICVRKGNDGDKKAATTVSVVSTTSKVDAKKDKAKDQAAKKKAEKKKDKAWDNIEVKEEGTKAKKDKKVLYKRNKKGEIVTDKNGKKVKRKASYPGEDEGWSPIVRPEDLKK